ncbi:MAG: hypothetical protein R2699_10645 [Acidimicrobiales bacterium]
MLERTAPPPTCRTSAQRTGHPLPFDNAAHPPTVVNEVNPAVSAGAGAMISTVEDLDVWAHELGTGTFCWPPRRSEAPTPPS